MMTFLGWLVGIGVAVIAVTTVVVIVGATARGAAALLVNEEFWIVLALIPVVCGVVWGTYAIWL